MRFCFLCTLLLLAPALSAACCAAAKPDRQALAPPVLSLAGPWQFALGQAGNAPESNDPPAEFNTILHLPGSIQEQGVGELPSLESPWTARIGLNLLKNPKYAPYRKPGDFKTPFWLTPNRVYVGSAWFKREISLPDDWLGKRVVLTLERPHWETTVFLDGTRVGSNNSLATPHSYDITSAVKGRAGPHTLIIRVDNRLRIPVGSDASAVTDHTQSNWNGIVGDITLQATPRLFIDDVQAYPDLAGRKARLKVRILNQQPGDAGGKGTLLISAAGRGPQSREEGFPPKSFPVAWDARGAAVELDVPLGEQFKMWDEFSPAVYDLTVTLKPDNTPPQTPPGELHSRTIPFGLREISTRGPQLLLNHKPLFLRGTLECAIFPLTGYPPAGDSPEARAYWTKIYSQVKAFGLNHVRFHSWCPPEIAFRVADEMGVYLQVEAGVWAAFGASGGPPVENRAEDAGGQGGALLDRWIVPETDAMLRAYGNHPSFILMAAANEPGSRTNGPNAAFLSALVDQWKAKDPRHLYTAGSNWPNVPNANFQVMSRPRLNSANVLGRQPQTTHDYSNVVAQWSMPVISHESGQWCAYPNFAEIPKYTGTLKPGNLEIFQDFLTKAGMGPQAHDFLMASGRFQALLYKEEIEALLRTPKLGGFQLLDLHDFPGQGTAPVGVLDAFWDSKGYISAGEYRHFCNATVPLVRLPKRVFTTGDTLTASAELFHFGPSDLQAARASWSLTDDRGTPLVAGRFEAKDIPSGSLSPLGDISLPLRDVPAPARLTLHVSIDGTPFANQWNLWVYPASSPPPVESPIHITRSVDDALARLAAGETVLLSPDPAAIAGNTRGSFAPIFWNRITFAAAKVHTLSILCSPAHPAFARFPTDMHTDWQWFDLLQRSKPVVLDGLPRELTPVVQIIDDWDTCRKLGLVFEASVGKGKLLFSAIDLTTDLSERPASAQFRNSLLTYMNSAAFSPKESLTPEMIRSLVTP